MEDWQEIHIQRNLVELIKFTTWGKTLGAVLLSEKVLSKEDVQEIEAGRTPIAQAYLFYQRIQTKHDGYKHLLIALQKTNQSGAVSILMTGFPVDAFWNSKISFLNKNVTNVSKVLEKNDVEEIFSNLQSTFTLDKYINLFLRENYNKEDADEPLQLVKNTIPPSLPYYIPRTLSKRTHIKKDIFQQDCEDVFVFKGIKRSQLSEVVKPNGTALSEDQLEEITARFILLKHYDDWSDLKEISKKPIHLIQGQNNNKFILEDTSGGSKILNHFLERSTTEGALINFAENDFVGISEDSKVTGICICDAPGMGKSELLANLARKISVEHPDRIVAFVPLLEIGKRVDTSSLPEQIEALLDCITPSPVARQVLSKILERNNSFRVDLFFDGFDEVTQEDLKSTKQFLKGITKLTNNTKIFVTSRPHMRHELEDTLGVIAYDIWPFNKRSQIDFFVQFWKSHHGDKKCDVSRLERFAKACIQNYKSSIPEEERDLVGIPLQCRMIGQVYADQACRYSRRDNMKMSFTAVTCIYDIYKNFMDDAFQKVNQLYQSKQPTATSSQDIYNFHVMTAINLLFPNLLTEFPDTLFVKTHVWDVKEKHKWLSLGILEEVHNQAGFPPVEFIHRTFAEFLVADFIGKMLTDKSFSKVSIITILFKHILFTIQNEKFQVADNPTIFMDISVDLFWFRNSSIVYFLNCQLKNTRQSGFCPSTAAKKAQLHTIISPLELYKIFLACARENFSNILNFTKHYLVNEQQSIKKLGDAAVNDVFEPGDDKSFFLNGENVCNVFMVACRYSTVPFLVEYTNLLQECCVSYDVKNIAKNLLSKTPLQVAVEIVNYEVAEFLLNSTFPVENQTLIHECVKYTSLDSLEKVEQRKELITLLLRKNNNIIDEKSENLFDTPLLGLYCHFELVKFLVAQGADLYATDMYGRSVADKAAEYMSPNDYHELVVFILNQRNKDSQQQFLAAENGALRQMSVKFTKIRYSVFQEMRLDTIELILKNFKWNMFEKDGEGNNVILWAVKSIHRIEIINLFKQYGFDHQATNDKGENALHLAVRYGNMETVQYFLSLGVLIDVRNEGGENALHVAVQMGCTAVVEHLVSTGADVHATDNLGRNVLHHLIGRFNFIKPIDLDGKIEAIRYFISLGVNIHATDHAGENVMHGAVRKGQMDMVRYIVSLGLDIHVTNNNGENVLHLAVQRGKAKVTNVTLLESSNELEFHGISSDEIEILEYFVSLGVNMHATTKNGENVLHLAARYGMKEAAKYFVDCGVDLSLCNGKGRTPLDVANDCLKSQKYNKSEENCLQEIVKAFRGVP